MLKEFREFALRGNVVDMAVGIVIGAAFGGIVNSLVGDVIMPTVGFLTGGIDFTNRYLLLRDGATVGPYQTLAAAQAAGAVTVNLGKLFTLVLNFLIVAFVLFMIIKAMNTARRSSPEPLPPPPGPTPDQTLLTEIRDLLRARP